MGEGRFWSPEHNPDVLSRLLTIWRESTQPDIQGIAAWAILRIPIIDRELNPFPKHDQELIEFIKEWFSMKEGSIERRHRVRTYLVIGFHLKTLWTDEELAELVANDIKEFGLWENGMLILEALGEPGREQLEKLRRET